MKSNRIIATVAGALVFLSIAITLIWVLKPADSARSQELTLNQLVARIDKREVKEISFKQSEVEVIDINGAKFYASIGSDATRESLLGTIKEYNKINASTPIKYTEEPVPSDFFWISVIHLLPAALFFIMWGATLAVIIYAVRTLSRNKS